MSNSPKISVVIPYFQREPGILRKTVLSALRQKGNLNYEIIVVDDQSPISAEDEIGNLLEPHKGKIRIIHQSNAGPGSARNRGIDNVSPDTQYIAFLDSDDCWLPNHLVSASNAFQLGADFYFSNHTQLNQSIGAFERASKLNLPNHARTAHPDIYHFNGDMIQQIITGNLIGTSTVVYSHSKYPGQRFDKDFSNAGEDYLMWAGLTSDSENIFFCTQVTCNYGKGVNIFSDAEWGTRKLSKRLSDEVMYKKLIAKKYSLDDEASTYLQQQIQENQKSLTKNTISMIKRFKFIVLYDFARHRLRVITGR